MGEYKFQSLIVYQLAINYFDKLYDLVTELPPSERYNLSSQIIRAATSIALNIAEGSTGQSDKEQGRFLGLALRSYIETVACLDLCKRRSYLDDINTNHLQNLGRQLFIKIIKFKNALQES